jgi:hypothetical protein
MPILRNREDLMHVAPYQPNTSLLPVTSNGDNVVLRLLERARRGGHGVIFKGMPGVVPHPTRGSLPNPSVLNREKF